MPQNDYRRLPVNPSRFFVVVIPRVRKKAWLKVDDTGVVLEASPRFQWAGGLAIEQVERWCRSKDLVIRRMHGNIKDIQPYL